MNFPVTYKSGSTSDTEHIGEELAKSILSNASLPRFVALYGDLGVGKTAFTRGFTQVVAPSARVKSPTFALVNQYKGDGISVFHFDMYRIEDEDELYSIGFFDYLDMGICLCEWSENIEPSLPEEYIRAEIIKDDPKNTDSRIIKLSIVKSTAGGAQ
ncbi:MAG: tRNA (adenosine(37)-N6)-threonylcarbamoyltransferase complex ATPase subunit type 1 TsaE [Clostridia bacterium]|nr:tRNA (adenosine(37)-N6)-threonylcarbamoyltransferase complex ATPase subunit type 1 TsaE [Clostridia bacterium]